MGTEELELPAGLLNNRCVPDSLGFETTDEVAPLEGMIGQERAVSALELALNIQDSGFNLFISGLPGTGRNTALKSHVGKVAAQKPSPPDWGYVHNFQDPSQPVAISLPCGWMHLLAADMDELVDTVRRDVARAFESDEYARRLETAVQGLEARRQELTSAMEMTAAEAGFILRSTPSGITPVPARDREPLSQEEFDALSEREREGVRQRADQLQHSINRAMTDIRRLGKSAAEEGQEVDKEIVRFNLTPVIAELQEKYGAFPEVVAYLDLVEADVVEHHDHLKPSAPDSTQSAQQTVGEDAFVRYRVNDLVDNTTCECAPIVVEHNPTYYNLFGRIDYRARMGMLSTDHTMIKCGAIHEANGGYLILQARDLLENALSWQTLKRTLQSREIRIENIGEQQNPQPSSTLRPKPVPLDAKIILVGTPDILRFLQSGDEDFRRYFRVNAEFDTVMDRTSDNVAMYAAFVAARRRDGDMKQFHKTAVARIIEHSSRLAEHQEKLTTRFIDVSDIITEANYWANSEEASIVKAEHVKKAVDQRWYRSSLRENRLQQLIKDDAIRISTEGEMIGQVNGLVVLGHGNTAFGKANRITAKVSLGRGQLLDVERETRLGGKIHHKGFMILTGYLRGKYGYDKHLPLSASISFEQSYSEIDGDSASSTELYALLSAISDLPISQGIGVTGSVNQNGDIQAIGGITQKIEGFFDICKAKGLSGRQGVLMPQDNLKNLALNDEVIAAVEGGLFHIYAVSTVNEGIGILTGVPAGDRQEKGGYPEGTVHYEVERRLKEMAQTSRKSSGTNSAEGNQEDISAAQ